MFNIRFDVRVSEGIGTFSDSVHLDVTLTLSVEVILISNRS